MLSVNLGPLALPISALLLLAAGLVARQSWTAAHENKQAKG